LPYALLSLIWISVVGLFLNLGTGLRLFHTADPFRLHVIVALSAVLFALFAHTMALFYFIGTGKRIKESIAKWESPAREGIRKRVGGIKRRLFPGLLGACLVLAAALILGGALDAGAVPRPAHAWAAYLAVLINMHVVVKETLYLFRNIALIEEVDDIARRKADSAEVSA
jgi:hypothetical protein